MFSRDIHRGGGGFDKQRKMSKKTDKRGEPLIRKTGTGCDHIFFYVAVVFADNA